MSRRAIERRLRELRNERHRPHCLNCSCSIECHGEDADGMKLKGPCKKCGPDRCPRMALNPIISTRSWADIAEKFAEATKELRPPHTRRPLTEEEARFKELEELEHKLKELMQ